MELHDCCDLLFEAGKATGNQKPEIGKEIIVSEPSPERKCYCIGGGACG
jgi:hypothetical protein